MPHHASGERDPRVFLAIERTFLAWTRTALALMGFGFVVARIGVFLRELAAAQPGPETRSLLLPQPATSLWLGIGLVVLGIVVQTLALVERRRQVQRFFTGEAIVSRGSALSTFVGVVLIALGIAIAAYLVRYV